MNEQNWLQTTVMLQLIDEAVEGIIRRYRIDAAVARELIERRLHQTPALAPIVERERTAERIKRTRVFKDAMAAIKKDIYYKLRRYNEDPARQEELTMELARSAGQSPTIITSLAEELTQLHSSTRERFAHREEFYRRLLNAMDRPKALLDIGCGLQPLLFPLNDLGPDWTSYLAIDKDPKAVAAVAAYARAIEEPRLSGLQWDIAEGWDRIRETSGITQFDVAFLFKLVPVVARQQPELLDVLRQTPARRLVISGSQQALTKRQNIEKRERAVLGEFCQATDRRVIAEFTVADEFALILDLE